MTEQPKLKEQARMRWDLLNLAGCLTLGEYKQARDYYVILHEDAQQKLNWVR